MISKRIRSGLQRWGLSFTLGIFTTREARAQPSRGGERVPASTLAQLPTGSNLSDSLMIRGVVRNWLGIRQAQARVKVINHPAVRSRFAIVASTWADKKGGFTLMLPRPTGADSLVLQALCAGKLRKGSLYSRYFFRADLPVDAARTKRYAVVVRRQEYHINFR